MVSPNPNPQSQDFYIDSMKMGLPCHNSLPPSSNFNTTAATTTTTTVKASAVWPSEDPNKKVRKPYTITKARESWTEQEHDKFLEALQLFDRDWKKIEAFVGSKTVIQIRSHAQKYFMKVQKSGTCEHVPPPRPKRKATHPYPQKAPKNAPLVSQVTGSFQSSGALVEPGYILSPDSLSLPGNTVGNPNLSYWTWNAVPPVDVSHVTKDEVGVSRSTVTQNCCSSSSNESTPRMWPTSVKSDEGKGILGKPVRVTPDFSKVYSFIGSVFDPNASDHLQKLKNMEPINVETVLLLMKNLAVNLTSPEFEHHREMLSSYNADAEKAKSSNLCNNLHLCKPENAIPLV